MNRQILWVLPACMLLLSACQETPKENTADQTQISKPLQTHMQRPSPATGNTIIPAHQQAPKTTARALGITVDDGKIIIDTKQTKTFLHSIGEKMQKSFDKIEATLKREKIDSPDETGIIITDTKMQIDLNKTRNFMERWMKSMESVVNELNKTMGEIKRGLPQK